MIDQKLQISRQEIGEKQAQDSREEKGQKIPQKEKKLKISIERRKNICKWKKCPKCFLRIYIFGEKRGEKNDNYAESVTNGNENHGFEGKY